ncbi:MULTISPECIES: hypothetical protein [Lysobacter]|uniref:hypothetical protein n=1 Tax=Lysobacter TaxID=68 RepID=UPI001F1739C8|nr:MULTISPECIES: hypothetical protein [Lysobacter]UJB18655.1 hypothetical protein L1A79_20405 [Lysobacter capsici]UJQ27620.1 hypothetical protein L2D09_19480 [Lysobacter gummosus]
MKQQGGALASSWRTAARVFDFCGNRRHFLQWSGGLLAGGGVQASFGHGHEAESDEPADGRSAAQFHACRRYAARPFGRIAYVERDAGPATLLLHGFALNRFQWRGALPRLAPYRHCIAPKLAADGLRRQRRRTSRRFQRGR